MCTRNAIERALYTYVSSRQFMHSKLIMQQLLVTHKVAAIVFDAKGLEQVLRSSFTRCESSVHAAISYHGTVFASELKVAVSMCRQSLNEVLRLVSNFVRGVRPVSSEGVLRPFRNFYLN